MFGVVVNLFMRGDGSENMERFGLRFLYYNC